MAEDGPPKDFQALGRRHDLTAILLRDPRDESLPPIGWVEVEDLERGERRLVNTSSRSVRAAYEREARERRAAAEQALGLARCPLIEVRTDRSYLPVLFRYNPRSGKHPPYEVEREACGACLGDDGKPTGVDGLGFACGKCKGERYVFVSHFAKCRDAAKWRGRSRR